MNFYNNFYVVDISDEFYHFKGMLIDIENNNHQIRGEKKCSEYRMVGVFTSISKPNSISDIKPIEGKRYLKQVYNKDGSINYTLKGEFDENDKPIKDKIYINIKTVYNKDGYIEYTLKGELDENEKPIEGKTYTKIFCNKDGDIEYQLEGEFDKNERPIEGKTYIKITNNSQGQTKEEVIYTTSGSLEIQRTIYKIDKTKKPNEKTVYNTDGSIDYTLDGEFYDDGDPIYCRTYIKTVYNKDRSVKYTLEGTFDEDEKPIEGEIYTKVYKEDGIEYQLKGEFDENEKPIEGKTYIKITNNSQGQTKEEVIYTTSGSLEIQRTIYKIDKTKKPNEKTVYNTDGSIDYTLDGEFDEDYKPIKDKEYIWTCYKKGKNTIDFEQKGKFKYCKTLGNMAFFGTKVTRRNNRITEIINRGSFVESPEFFKQIEHDGSKKHIYEYNEETGLLFKCNKRTRNGEYSVIYKYFDEEGNEITEGLLDENKKYTRIEYKVNSDKNTEEIYLSLTGFFEKNGFIKNNQKYLQNDYNSGKITFTKSRICNDYDFLLSYNDDKIQLTELYSYEYYEYDENPDEVISDSLDKDKIKSMCKDRVSLIKSLDENKKYIKKTIDFRNKTTEYVIDYFCKDGKINVKKKLEILNIKKNLLERIIEFIQKCKNQFLKLFSHEDLNNYKDYNSIIKTDNNKNNNHMLWKKDEKNEIIYYNGSEDVIKIINILSGQIDINTQNFQKYKILSNKLNDIFFKLCQLQVEEKLSSLKKEDSGNNINGVIDQLDEKIWNILQLYDIDNEGKKAQIDNNNDEDFERLFTDCNENKIKKQFKEESTNSSMIHTEKVVEDNSQKTIEDKDSNNKDEIYKRYKQYYRANDVRFLLLKDFLLKKAEKCDESFLEKFKQTNKIKDSDQNISK